MNAGWLAALVPPGTNAPGMLNQIPIVELVCSLALVIEQAPALRSLKHVADAVAHHSGWLGSRGRPIRDRPCEISCINGQETAKARNLLKQILIARINLIWPEENAATVADYRAQFASTPTAVI